MSAFLDGLHLVLSPGVGIALLVGSVGGVVIGAIPGVGPAAAIAMLLPATFMFDPLIGLTLLLGVYGSSLYGGALPAILINTPGTAVNALTTYDGHPMAKRGDATKALGLAFGASCAAGLLSTIALVLLAPAMAAIAPHFGSREIFLAALLGTVLVIITHRGQTLVAGFLAAFGLFLSTVGMEPAYYSQRYTFGFEFLASGINLIVVVLGLFALSQAFILLSGHDLRPAERPMRGNLARAMTRIFGFKRTVAAGSGIGVLMGMLPGVGEFTAQFLSYAYARKTSKTPEQFGKGSEEGLIASESANNAVPAAAMIPLLALGIPGEALTAMMLSVFYVHGVIPGPALFQSNLDIVYALFIALILLNVIVVIFLAASSRLILKLVHVSSRFLGMMILTLSFVGVYSLRNSLTDCCLAAGFGLLGFVLKRHGLPVVPIVIGMVMGGIMEVRLRSAMARVNNPLDFLDRPGSAVLAFAIFALLIAHGRTVLRDFRGRNAASGQ